MHNSLSATPVTNPPTGAPVGGQAIAAAFRAAFPYTIPIFAGFCFLGMTYGIYMNVSGFSFWYPLLMSLTIYGGSLEFVAVSMLLAPYAPLQCFLMALMIQARHLFYGISMLDKFKGLGWKKPYLIFGMCDETFSINYTVQIPDGIDRGWFYFFVTLLNQFYWVGSAHPGRHAGQPDPLQYRGAGFCHDRHVRCHLHGAVAQGKASCQRMGGTPRQCRLPAPFRRG